MPTDIRARVFVSYSRADSMWLDRLRGFLKEDLDIWDDSAIQPGGDWFENIRETLDSASVIVCLLSPDYLASPFLAQEEIPYIFEKRRHEGAAVVPIVVRPCEWQNYAWLRETQVIPADGRPLSELRGPQADTALQGVAEMIEALAGGEALSIAAPSRLATPAKVDLTRLPPTGGELLGRQTELLWLDRAWTSRRQRIATLVGWGGLGKTTLVKRWLEYLEEENYRGAERVYGWSFQDQSSADLFVAEALTWFENSEPLPGSAWGKGELLASLIGQKPTLLVLDGLESLQSPVDGVVRDPAIAALLDELTRQSHGLCVITTRQQVPELERERAATRLDLERLSLDAGLALLRVGGVRGTADELQRAVSACGHHALALSLLVGYLADAPERKLSSMWDILGPVGSDEVGVPVRRILAAFEARGGEGPEVQVLQMLAVVDRLATNRELDALTMPPVIPGLNDTLDVTPGWPAIVQRLRRARLVAPADTRRSDVLDTHPLIRQYFAESVQQRLPVAWREGHNRLFELLVSSVSGQPKTFEELAPLYAAVLHGVRAGRATEAWHDVYWGRIERGEEFFASHTFGAVSANLAALSNFIDPSTGDPLPELSDESKGWVLNEIGIALQSLGRLDEAVGPLERGLALREANREWRLAAWSAQNLYELHLLRGNLTQALECAQRSAAFAVQAGDSERLMISLSANADAQHHVGRLEASESLFREAQQVVGHGIPFVTGTPGYWYSDLLLDMGREYDVERRVSLAAPTGVLLDDALYELTLGRLGLAHEPSRISAAGEIEARLNAAVDLLRRAGRLDYLPRALLARAEMRRRAQLFDDAETDLKEVYRLSTRARMRLYEVEFWLENARLYRDRGKAPVANAHLAQARDLVEAVGYDRRRAVVNGLQRELDAMIKGPGPVPPRPPEARVEDALSFLFRLVLDRRAPPELLLHLDPRQLPESIGGPAEIAALDAQLAEQYAGVEPNALWLSWVRATRAQDVTQLDEQLTRAIVRPDPR